MTVRASSSGTPSPSLDFVLPSDKAWRMKNYYKLVEKHRSISPLPTSMGDNRAEHWNVGVQAQLPIAERVASASRGLSLTRSVADIVKAGRLLANPPSSVRFSDEEEMRRVYSLIYDVFRYKTVLNQALLDIQFYLRHPALNEVRRLVLVLFYDLYQRHFNPRLPGEEVPEERDLAAADATLWAERVHLAAAVARLRIKNRALHLTSLLPQHLRDERAVALHQTVVSSWINTFMTTKENVIISLKELDMLPLGPNDSNLRKNYYQFDHLCPKVILYHPTRRMDLAKSALVAKHQIVFQDRAFCLGPAIMSKVLLEVELTGCVALTHINSPRTIAYLANVLADNDRITHVIAFGGGDRTDEYEKYLKTLKIRKVSVREERFVECSPDALEGVAAVLAAPPNSYSGVVDPVDLVCSRGGDLAMLSILTESELDEDSKARVRRILEEQHCTLRIAMSQPQIQVVVYETHSIVPAENSLMVKTTVEEVNQIVIEKHLELFEQHPEDPETYKLEEIPPCDLFEVGKLPDLCPNKNACLRLEEQGCYLAVIKRKEIVRLDAKYMIKVAESRGLFGSKDGEKKTASGRVSRRKETSRTAEAASDQKPGDRVMELERIAAHTHASLVRRGEAAACVRKQRSLRLWWRQAARHAVLPEPLRPPLRLARRPLQRALSHREPLPLRPCPLVFSCPEQRLFHCFACSLN